MSEKKDERQKKRPKEKTDRNKDKKKERDDASQAVVISSRAHPDSQLAQGGNDGNNDKSDVLAEGGGNRDSHEQTVVEYLLNVVQSMKQNMEFDILEEVESILNEKRPKSRGAMATSGGEKGQPKQQSVRPKSRGAMATSGGEKGQPKQQSVRGENVDEITAAVTNVNLVEEKGCYKKHWKKCVTCNDLKETKYFYDNKTGEKYDIKYRLTCDSKGVVYLINCLDCNKQYAGKTRPGLNKRHIGHRHEMKIGSSPLGRHFQENKSDCKRYELIVIDQFQENSGKTLRDLESAWITVLDLKECGINKQK